MSEIIHIVEGTTTSTDEVKVSDTEDSYELPTAISSEMRTQHVTYAKK